MAIDERMRAHRRMLYQAVNVQMFLTFEIKLNGGLNH